MRFVRQFCRPEVNLQEKMLQRCKKLQIFIVGSVRIELRFLRSEICDFFECNASEEIMEILKLEASFIYVQNTIRNCFVDREFQSL